MNRRPGRSFALFGVMTLLAPLLVGAAPRGCVEQRDGGDAGGGGTGGAGGGADAGAACFATGCSRQVCADEEVVTTCEFREAYLCYRDHGICERDLSGACGWRPTPELQACLGEVGREPVSAYCTRSSGEACEDDADCASGGCGGELCYNPSGGARYTTCDCVAPEGVACGCVAGACTWWR